MQCGVCDDIATGVHYGLATCEGCKGMRLFLKYILINGFFV
jgi:hypothetical protein